jgi:hypothetical protein
LSEYLDAANPTAVGQTTLDGRHEFALRTAEAGSVEGLIGDVGDDDTSFPVSPGEEGNFSSAKRTVAVEEDLKVSDLCWGLRGLRR